MTIDDLWSLEHSQYSEDVNGYPFHIMPLKDAVNSNMTDCIHNHRKQNKWQVIFVGTQEQCVDLLVELEKIKEK